MPPPAAAAAWAKRPASQAFTIARVNLGISRAQAPGKKVGEEMINKVAILRVNPWLAYGCGDGARLAVRKPGATESTASTLQRTLRDDYVVVRRDGSDSELTVDPTPFTVVPCGNPRYGAGTRLLIVYENACVDACVEKWPDGEIDIKDGSRHHLRVEGKQLSGWVTLANTEGAPQSWQRGLMRTPSSRRPTGAPLER